MESPLNSDEKIGLLPLAVLAVIFVIAAPVFWQEVELRPSAVAVAPENQDLREYYVPVYGQVYGALLAGRIPEWDSTRLCGTSLIGDPRTAMFQPLNLVFLLAPFPEAFAVHAFTCLALAGIAFLLFARSLGVGVTAALFGGLCFAFSGAAAGAMSRPPLAAAMVWIPVVLWSARVHARHPRSASVVFMGLALAGLLLSGALAIFAVMACLAATYVLVAAVAVGGKRRVSVVRAMVGMFAAVFLCGLICAVQWMPLVRQAVLLDDLGMLVRAVLPAGTLPGGLLEAAGQIAAPEDASLPSLIYLGVVGIVFLPAALLQRRHLVEGWFYSFAAVGLVAVAVLSGALFSQMVPPYAVVYPAMGCAAVACALGVDRIMQKQTGPGREWYWLGAGLVLSSCVAMFVVGNTLTRGYVTVVVGLVVVSLMVRGGTVRGIVGLLICGLAWTNLVTASRNVFGHPFESRSAAGFLDDRDGTFGLEGGRLVVAGALRDGDVGLEGSVARADGFGALLSREEAVWWRALSGDEVPTGRFDDLPDLRLLGAMSGSLVLAEGDIGEQVADLTWETSSAGSRYALNDAAIPRAHWVTSVEWVDGIEDAISSIRGSGDGVDRVAYLDSGYRHLSDFVGMSNSSASTNATASIQDVSPEHVVVTLRTPVRGILVLADSFSPDWRAEVDEVPVSILRVNGLFRGVEVSEGDHVVEFRYRPLALYVGGIVSLGTLVLLGLWGLVRLFR